jgi:hypothetical protein
MNAAQFHEKYISGWLVPHWRVVWRYASARTGVLGGALVATYGLMYDKLKGDIPPRWMLGLTVLIFFISVSSQYVHQKKLDPPCDKQDE